jgi:hypothetical protein
LEFQCGRTVSVPQTSWYKYFECENLRGTKTILIFARKLFSEGFLFSSLIFCEIKQRRSFQSGVNCDTVYHQIPLVFIFIKFPKWNCDFSGKFHLRSGYLSAGGKSARKKSSEKPTRRLTNLLLINWVTMDCLILQNEERLKQVQTWELNEEIQVFREYLRIPSVHPNINYSEFCRP